MAAFAIISVAFSEAITPSLDRPLAAFNSTPTPVKEGILTC
jgi:hypothetical protein